MPSNKLLLKPDIVSIAKGLGGGFPIGGILGTTELFDTFSPGTHGTTFGGNPLAVAVAQKVIDIVFQQDFLDEVKKKSDYFVEKLKAAFHNGEFKVKGRGLLIGLEGENEVAPAISKLEEAGLLVCSAGTKVIRLLPPLTVSYEEIDQAIDILKKVFV